MTVYKRGTKWHYRFVSKGRDFFGPCIGCETKKEAERYQEQKRAEAAAKIADMEKTEREIRANKTVAALVENYRKELSGGKDITLAEAYDMADAKPSRYKATSSYAELKRTYWDDFTTFMAATYPDIKDLGAVRRSHCEAYVSYLIDHGRFIKEKTYNMSSKKRNGSLVKITRRIHGISEKTISEIASVCKSVFTRLEEDAGIARNPWTGVVLPAQHPVKRDLFTADELILITNGIKNDDFCRPLFIIAANSGLTEGDICTLKWEEIDFAGEMIRHVRRKMKWKKEILILCPIIPELAAYLWTLPRTSEYVLPIHAERYLNSQSNVSYKVTTFLNGLGIKTRKDIPGRKSVSTKDLHSMRHVFAYRAKRAGISEQLLEKMLGHEVLEMTRHYADHDTEDDLRSEIKKLPPLLIEGETGANQGEEVERKRLMELIPQLPIELVRRWLDELSRGLPGSQ